MRHLYFPYFSQHNVGPVVFRMEGTDYPVMINLMGFLKRLHSDFGSAAPAFYLLCLIWPQLSTPPVEVMSVRETHPTALQ